MHAMVTRLKVRSFETEITNNKSSAEQQRTLFLFYIKLLYLIEKIRDRIKSSIYKRTTSCIFVTKAPWLIDICYALLSLRAKLDCFCW